LDKKRQTKANVMKTTKCKVSVRRIEALVGKIKASAEALREAGAMLVQMLEEDPQVLDRIVERHPEVPRGLLVNLERVGRGAVMPELILREGPQWRSLERLPYREQERVFHEGVKVYVPQERENGAVDWKCVPAARLTYEEARQAIGPDGVRTPMEQRRWRIDEESRRARRRQMDAAQGRVTVHADVRSWRVQREFVEIPPHGGVVRLTEKQLVELLAQMHR